MAHDKRTAIEQEGPPGDRKLSFSEHLTELRSHLIRATIVFLSIAVICFLFTDPIVYAVRQPFEVAREELLKSGHDIGKLTQVDPTESFFFMFKIAMYAALLVGAPYGLFEMWRFISVGLYPKERRAVMRLVPYSVAMFGAGALFAYFYLLPTSLVILLSFGSEWIDNQIRLDAYLGFFITFNLLLGAIFQLPLVQYVLARFGILSGAQQGSHRKGFIMGATLASAILTPTGDAFTLMMVAVPMVVLFEVGLIIAKRVSRASKGTPA